MSSLPPFVEALVALVFPDRCAGCAGLGSLFCSACRAALTPYPGTLKQMPPGLADIQIAFVFEQPIREAIHQLKYRRRRRVARALGGLLIERLRASPCRVEAVVPIPMHADRLRERGFNQAEALAREVALGAGLPFVGEGLARVRATEQQARLNAQQRRDNLRGAFAWRATSPPPGRVLLIDDVLTTGSTMSACATALVEAGAREVSGLALARSRPDL